jgi:hypothetical protein
MIAAIKDKRRTVESILRDIGKPTETAKLVKEVAEINSISEPQAYREIRKADRKKDIIKVTLPDRRVLNLLPEWTLSPISQFSPNHLQFLWLSLWKIRAAQNKGDFVKALTQSVSLLDYLPNEFREEFRDRADTISQSIELITAGNLPKLQNIADPFEKSRAKNKLMKEYCKKAFSDFFPKLSAKLMSIDGTNNIKEKGKS